MKHTEKQKEYDSFVEKYNEELEKNERIAEANRIRNQYINILIGVIGIIILIFVSGLTIYFANIDFDYNLKKCSTLDSSQSAYDFTNTMEIDAQYNEECYYLENHPYARFNRVYLQATGAGVLGTIFFVLLLVLIKTLCVPIERSLSW